MINPLIKDQLSKIRRIEVPAVNDSTNVITLHKDQIKQASSGLHEDCCYLISVEDYILNPPDGFTLHTNWNNNIAPKHKVMKVDVTKIMGKMVKVNSMGYDMKNQVDTNDMWSGWLPQKSITIIERL